MTTKQLLKITRLASKKIELQTNLKQTTRSPQPFRPTLINLSNLISNPKPIIKQPLPTYFVYSVQKNTNPTQSHSKLQQSVH